MKNKCYILQIKSQDKPKLSLNNRTFLYPSERAKISRRYTGAKAEQET